MSTEARGFCCLCFVWPVTTNAQAVKIWQPPPNGTSYVLYNKNGSRNSLDVGFFHVFGLGICFGISNFKALMPTVYWHQEQQLDQTTLGIAATI